MRWKEMGHGDKLPVTEKFQELWKKSLRKQIHGDLVPQFNSIQFSDGPSANLGTREMELQQIKI